MHLNPMALPPADNLIIWLWYVEAEKLQDTGSHGLEFKPCALNTAVISAAQALYFNHIYFIPLNFSSICFDTWTASVFKY